MIVLIAWVASHLQLLSIRPPLCIPCTSLLHPSHVLLTLVFSLLRLCRRSSNVDALVILRHVLFFFLMSLLVLLLLLLLFILLLLPQLSMGLQASHMTGRLAFNIVGS